MNFEEALKILNIEDYKERIFNSNSHGELFYLMDYIFLAETYKDDTKWFREWFKNVVKQAEEKWQRPSSIYQHIVKILKEHQSN